MKLNLDPDEEYFEEVDDKNLRVYEINGEKHYSVTSILSRLPEDKHMWANIARAHDKRNPDYPFKEYSGDAMLCGTYFHYAASCDLADTCNLSYPKFEPTRPLPNRHYTNKDGTFYRLANHDITLQYWKDFCRVARPTIVGQGLERFLYHSSRYAGRVDAVLKFDWQEIALLADHFKFARSPQEDDIWIVDFKTSKGIYDHYPAQVWAYMQAWNELAPPAEQANRMAILRCNGETGWEFVEMTQEMSKHSICKVYNPVTRQYDEMSAVDCWHHAMVLARRSGLVPYPNPQPAPTSIPTR